MAQAPAHLNKSNHGHMLFVGGIPYDMKQEEFEREIANWKGVCDKYYGGVTKGWGSVSFDTIANRNAFLNDKRKHVIGKKIVDVKPYGKPKEETKPGSGLGLGSMNLSSGVSSISTNTVLNKPVPMNIAPEPVPLPPIPTPVTKTEPSITVLEQALANCQTGAILRYISPNFGVLRTPKHGNGVFHADAVYLCSQHNLACKTVNCPDYTEFTSISGTKKRGSIFASLPVGTQVNFLGRPIQKASFPDIEFKFQATLVWPQLSKKPSSVTKQQDSVLDEQLRKFVLLEQRFVEDNECNIFSSKKMQIANMVDADDQISLDDDSDFDEDLNVGDLDNVLDQMSAIKKFLRNIGFANELPLLGLANRLMAIKDEDKAIEAIMQCLEESRIKTDESKKISIIANYRSLQQALRRRSGVIGSPSTVHNNSLPLKSSMPMSSNSPNSNNISSGFSFQSDLGLERTSSSVIARPQPGLLGYGTTPSVSAAHVDFNEELLEERFEFYFYKRTRASEFSWIEKDETVKKQCKIVTALWKDVGYTISKLAMEFEIYNDLPASDNPRNVLLNKWSEKLRGKNGNNRVLMYNEKIAAVSMEFFENKVHHKCITGKNLDPHFELRNYFEMFTKGHSLKTGQQHHPHAKHLKKALRSLKMDKNLIQLAYEAFNDSCDPSKSSMAEKLPGWRTTFRKLLEKHENYQGAIPDQACDHVFIYLDTRNFTNKPILSDSDEDTNGDQSFRASSPSKFNEYSNSGSKDDLDKNSIISDSVSVTSSLNNGFGGGNMNSRSSSLDPTSKQVGNKKLPMRRKIDKETRSNSLSSSSTKDPMQDISDNFLDGEHFVPVNIKSCGNSFKTCPSNDSTTAVAVAKLVDAGGEYHPYQHFIKWLKENYKVVQKDGHPIENTALYIRTIVDAWIKAEKPVSELKEEFRKGFGEPAALYSEWAKCVETNMETAVTASVDSVIKTTFQYCWEALSLSKTIALEENNQVLQLFRNISYKTDEGFYHVRGIVIHHFSEDFGLIQTRFGKVLYERNIAYTMKPDPSGANSVNSNGSTWRRCKSSSLVFNKHVMVKLHFKVGKFKVKKNAVKYLYATKVWLSFPSSTYSEPSSGVCVLGRDGYWKDVCVEFEKIVKANTSIRYHSEPSECSSVSDYRQAYSTALKYRHKLLLLTHGIRNMDDSLKADNSFDDLIAYVENSHHLLDPIHRDEVISTIMQLSTRDVNFVNVRRACLLHTLINTSDCFEADLELMLLSNMRANNQGKAFVTPNVCDVVPFIIGFLCEQDSVFQNQFEEQKKILQKEKKGSLSQLENIISIINSLYVVENAPPLSVLLPPSEEILTKTQIRQTRQAALMRDQLEDDNSDDIDVDFDIEAELTNIEQKENDIGDALGSQILKNNEYLDKENKQNNSNGACSKASRKIEDSRTMKNMEINASDDKIPLPPEVSNNIVQGQLISELKPINLESSEQFMALQNRIIELEAWKEQRVKEDNAFKDTINLTFTKVLDKLVELDQNYQVLKAQHISLQNTIVTNPNRIRNGQRSFIKITTSDNHDIHEFPSDEEGNLSVASVNAVYQGVNALKYKILETGAIRLCSKNGDMFEPPEDGWGNRLYFANITSTSTGTSSTTLPGSNNLGLAAVHAAAQAQVQSQQTPTFRGQAPFPQYGAGLPYNPVSVASLRAATLQQGGLSNNTNSNSFFGPLINGTSYKLDS